MVSIKTLLIDNYDSYTYNLYQLISDVNGVRPLVVKNDRVTVSGIRKLLADGVINNIVVSPGPGTPEEDSDIGSVRTVLQNFPDVPIFGVCLGHQALASVHGARVVRAPEPVHGRLSALQHTCHPLFRDIPSGVDSGLLVVRYHSLVVDASTLPDELEAICWTCGGTVALSLAHDRSSCAPSAAPADRLLMGLAHRTRPHFGVQFHPESIATKFGPQLLWNFASLTAQQCQVVAPSRPVNPAGPPGGTRSAAAEPGMPWISLNADAVPLSVAHDCCTCAADMPAMELLDRLGITGGEHTFWLDSAEPERSRFSFLGKKGGPHWRKITYKMPPVGQVDTPGTIVQMCADGNYMSESSTFFGWLERFMAKVGMCPDSALAHQLPFDFWGGLVGYLGYELKGECGASNAHACSYADAAFFFVDRVAALDHHTGTLYFVALHDGSEADERCARDWISQTKAAATRPFQPATLSTLDTVNGEAPSTANGAEAGHAAPAQGQSFRLQRGHKRYLQDIQDCMNALHSGDSYEICLTNAMHREGDVDSWRLYQILRRINKAPYAAWLHFGQDDPVVCSSSPERFLRLDRRSVLEARPIKGTAARVLDDPVQDAAVAAALAASEKDRAENLMIVDLLRNDLGRVCEPGTVSVPGMMEIETFASVHQLVSTVEGRKTADLSAAACLQAAFPGGSMTGAPKIRSMEIIDKLEAAPRGAYSGSIGYLSVNGTFDFNIVIRTAVTHGGRTSIGAGGAIVVQSAPEGEYEEMLLKARRLLQAFAQHDGVPQAPLVDPAEL